MPSFAAKVNRSLLIRRLGIAANNTEVDTGVFQLDTVDEATIQFRDITKIESESHIFEQAWEGADE